MGIAAQACSDICEKTLRGMIPAELNNTNTAEPRSQSETNTPIIILPIIGVVILLLGIMVGACCCAKCRKKKKGKEEVADSSSGERIANQRKSSKRKLQNKWKRKEGRKEIEHSTE
ncbi:uncharacterized protein LOC144592357 [Rhinoraja longicauda]